MPKKRLHCAQRSAHGIEQSCIGMPQPVPGHARQPQPLTSGLELPVDEIVPVERCPRTRAKHQSVGIHSGWLKSRKNLDGLCPQGNRPLAALTLGFIE